MAIVGAGYLAAATTSAASLLTATMPGMVVGTAAVHGGIVSAIRFSEIDAIEIATET